MTQHQIASLMYGERMGTVYALCRCGWKSGTYSGFWRRYKARRGLRIHVAQAKKYDTGAAAIYLR
jgi:hypothetical protein